MILVHVSLRCISTKAVETYHRFVNTTPNPNATKNRSGELVPELPWFEFAMVAVGDGAGVVDVCAAAGVDVWVSPELRFRT